MGDLQEKALRLADELFDGIVFGGVSIELAREAQNELRRLHEVNQILVGALEMALEALKDEKDFRPNEKCNKAIQALRQALSKAKEQE